jgi:cell wall-associated NlpC family hydrolase
MTTREQIVEEARTYLGTPFHHQARLRGVAVDCVGLIVGVAHALGLSDADYTQYPRRPNGELVPQLERAGYREIEIAAARPGDLLCLWLLPRSRKPAHLAIRTDYGIIHTDGHVGRVVEISYADDFVRRTCAAYAFPGVED